MKTVQLSVVLASLCVVILLGGSVYGVSYSIAGLTSDESVYSLGSKVTITGVLKQDGAVKAYAYVNVEVAGPTKTVWLDSAQTDSSGVFSTSFKLADNADVGDYTVYATYIGVRASTNFAVAEDKEFSSIIVTSSSTSISYMQNMTLKATASPPQSDGTITFQYSISFTNPMWMNITSLTPSEGNASTIWVPPAAGTYYLRAIWSGDDIYAGSTSTTQNIIVYKAPPSLTTVQATWEGNNFDVGITTDSTITGFNFTQSKKQICFQISGITGTTGFTTIIIPKTLIGGDLVVMIDGVQTKFELQQNSTHSFISLTYTHSTHTITIQGTTAIPEYPISASWMLIAATILLLSLIAGLRRFRTRSNPSTAIPSAIRVTGHY